MDNEQVNRIFSLIHELKPNISISDEQILFDIEEIIERGCNYIQDSKFPLSCERTVARNLIRVYNIDTDIQGATQIKEGQTTVVFAKPIDYDTTFDTIKSSLNPFRRLAQEGLNVKL